MKVREPEFTPDEVARLIESRRFERSLGPHGFPMDEATDPANQWVFEGAAVTDWAEKARLDKLDRMRTENKDANFNGVTVQVRKKR